MNIPPASAIKPICLAGLLVALSGCSQKFNDVNDTIKLAVFGDPDISLTREDINRSPYASIYAQIDNGPQAFMVLALAEKEHTLSTNPTTAPAPQQLKWVSADKGMLVTQSGRLVKTLNLPQGNLVSVHSAQPDPLALGLHLSDTPHQWQATYDWQPGYHYGYIGNSTFSLQGNNTIVINQTAVETLHVIETVNFDTIDISYQNHYWLNPTTGTVMKSSQHLAPTLPVVTLTVLKPFS
ncbi:lipoprotein YmcC precursor [Photobacterium aquae]|uniref:Lipoprotein YmcC n=1 Tax=Photobacterium aquae TaxID=1195763 RepID=A0A0J1GWC5_9GAMM|nr:YjbF family lipoprotein [Photobacterium aquae]KLV03995.1 lipoprotein YmcC precursor [Photobacterium aquae]